MLSFVSNIKCLVEVIISLKLIKTIVCSSFTALEAKMAQDGIVLTESQLQVLENIRNFIIMD